MHSFYWIVSFLRMTDWFTDWLTSGYQFSCSLSNLLQLVWFVCVCPRLDATGSASSGFSVRFSLSRLAPVYRLFKPRVNLLASTYVPICLRIVRSSRKEKTRTNESARERARESEETTQRWIKLSLPGSLVLLFSVLRSWTKHAAEGVSARHWAAL